MPWNAFPLISNQAFPNSEPRPVEFDGSLRRHCLFSDNELIELLCSIKAITQPSDRELPSRTCSWISILIATFQSTEHILGIRLRLGVRGLKIVLLNQQFPSDLWFGFGIRNFGEERCSRANKSHGSRNTFYLAKSCWPKNLTLQLVTLILQRHAPGSTYFVDLGTTFYLKTKSHTYTYPYT